MGQFETYQILAGVLLGFRGCLLVRSNDAVEEE
jgi:hypothetical protein